MHQVRRAMPVVKGGFLVFLPQDEASVTDPAAEEVASLLAADLGRLLALPDSAFRSAAAKDTSLLACIDSYLQHCRRQHDEGAAAAGDASAARASLHRAVFFVLLRTAETGVMGKAIPLLSVARLLDAAILYGSDNATLVGQLIAQAFQLDASLAGEVAQVAEAAAQNIGDVCTACVSRAQSTPLLSSLVVDGLSDGVVYLRDVCLTLAAFLAVAPATASLIIGDGGSNLAALAPLHDELLFALESSAQRQNPPASGMLRLVGHLRLAVVQLAALLLQDACLSAHEPLPGSPVAAAAGSAEECAATARGELLLTSLIALGPIDGGASSSFLAAVSQRMSMPAAVAAAAAHGVLKLDSAQRDYLSALLGGPLPEAEVSLLSQGVTSGNFESISQEELQSAAHALPLVKDVLPDFGDGFLTAALLHFGNASEKVINALLEGSLPPELAALDSQAATLPQGYGARPGVSPPSDHRSHVSSSATWQGLAAEAVVNEREGRTPRRPPPQPSLAARQKPAHRATARALDKADATTRGAIKAAAHAAQWDEEDDEDVGGAYGGSGSGYGAGVYGGHRGGGGEYDDEYDDSFDAYGGGAADGVADAEGEDEESRGGISSTSAGHDGGRDRGRSAPPPAGRGGRGRGLHSAAHSAAPGGSRHSQQQNQRPHQPLQQRQQQSTAAAVAAAQAALAPWRKQSPGQPQEQQQQQQQQQAMGHQQTQQQQQQQRPSKPQKAWNKDGKVYNYAKEGATLVNGPSAAHTAATAAASAAAEIHGLGRGGNVPHQPQPSGTRPGSSRPDSAREGDGGRGRGRGRGRGDGSEGSKAEHLRKDQRKASVANHHRKERAARKQGMV